MRNDTIELFIPEMFIDGEWKECEEFRRPYEAMEYAEVAVTRHKYIHPELKFRVRVEKYKHEATRTKEI